MLKNKNMELTDYIEIIEKFEKKDLITKTTWEFLSQRMPLYFIEKHINDYAFMMNKLAENENLTINFVNKYIYLKKIKL